MTLLLVLLLLGTLAVGARLLVRQNRGLRELAGAVRASQPLLRGERPGLELPAWPALTAAVNELIAETSGLRQRRSGELAQLEATLGNLREAVLVVDDNNYIHLANQALREIFPRSRDLGNLRLELIVRSAAFLDFVRATRAGEAPPRQEFELADGGPVWIEVSGAPIAAPDGKGRWALFVIHDVTRQRRLERTRRDFVANASHELRTPLSVIQGYIETLVDDHATMPAEERERFLRTIQRHGARLNAIIADLLTLSRLESGTPGLVWETIDLHPFLAELGADFRARAGASGHHLELRVDASAGAVRADREKLTQVFSNLLDNALKYSPPGSRVVLAASAAGGDAAVDCAVRDDGPGIPAEDLPHIFERFYRVEKGRSRERGGTGLGLSIVKHIVQLHGGRVAAESAPGRGTSILLRLPRSGPPPGSRE